MVSQKSRDWLLNRPGRHPQARDVHIAPDRCPAGPSRPADNPAAGYGRMFPIWTAYGLTSGHWPPPVSLAAFAPRPRPGRLV